MITRLDRPRAMWAPGLAAVAIILVAGCAPAPSPQVRVVSIPSSSTTTVDDARRYLMAGPAPQVVLAEAERYRAAGNRDAVFLLVKYAANAGKGDPRAVYEMGRYYDPATFMSYGIVREANAQTARDLYRSAANAGHVRSMLRLGQMYKEGLLAPPEDVSEEYRSATERSLFWFEKAARAGGVAQ